MTAPFLQLLLLLLVCSSVTANEPLNEHERLIEYYNRGYDWPPTKFIPDTPGWSKLMQERIAQIEEMTDPGKRYQAYHLFVHAALLCPNFTEYGFGLARAPEPLTQELREVIKDGLATAEVEEGGHLVLGPNPPLFIDARMSLRNRVLRAIQPYAQAWAKVELVPHTAYGFRLYQNGSQLMMHADRKNSHVISLIYHVDSSEDAEPWPIYIEDYHGQTHEVVLTPGDLLFYESSKLAHGRPKPLRGSWYTSIFVHYYPVGWPEQQPSPEMLSHFRIPPTWGDPAKSANEIPLDMEGMSLKEPTCPNLWCRTQDTVQWSGPGQEGVWITPDGAKIPLLFGGVSDEL